MKNKSGQLTPLLPDGEVVCGVVVAAAAVTVESEEERLKGL